jgi:hypothetical protein
MTNTTSPTQTLHKKQNNPTQKQQTNLRQLHGNLHKNEQTTKKQLLKLPTKKHHDTLTIFASAEPDEDSNVVPGRHITNSNLEQAALLAQVNVMAHSHPVGYATLENFSDNTPAVPRIRKGAVSAPGPACYLCQLASDHQRLQRYFHTVSYIPGPQNAPANDMSGLQHLTDASFHSHFQQQYPLPQAWLPQPLQPEMNSKLISMLLCKPQTPLLSPRLAHAGSASSTTGLTSAPPTSAIHPSVTSPILKRDSATYLSTDTEFEAGLPQKPARWHSGRSPPGRGHGDCHTGYAGSQKRSSRIQQETSLTGFLPQRPLGLLTSTPSRTKMTHTHAPAQLTSPSSKTCTKSLIPRTPSMGDSTNTSLISALLDSSGSSGQRNASQPTQVAALMVGNRLVPATDTSLNDFDTESRITWATLMFNNQKNAVRGKQIGHAATNDPQLCPCKALTPRTTLSFVHAKLLPASPRTCAQSKQNQTLPSTSTNILTSCASMSVLQT